MAAFVVSGLVMATGVVSAVVGMVAARSRLRAAGRTYRRMEMLYGAMPEGWGSRFVSGFSGLTMGAHWLWATLVLMGWLAAGVLLISLGLQVCR